MHVIEFKRGKDKKKRKRRTEMGASVRKGAKIGLAVGGVSTALNLANPAFRKNIGSNIKNIYDSQRNRGVSRVLAGAKTGAAVGLANGSELGTLALLGAGVGAGATSIARASRNPLGNARADNAAERRRRQRQKR
jgi:hypothetical protein